MDVLVVNFQSEMIVYATCLSPISFNFFLNFLAKAKIILFGVTVLVTELMEFT